MDYRGIKEAVESGIPASQVCATCSWTNTCVAPPTMTSEQVKEEIAKFGKPKEGDKPTDSLVGTLIGTLAIGSRDKLAEVCPLFANRLRASRDLTDAIKRLMQEPTE